jgi:hypothetical protein
MRPTPGKALANLIAVLLIGTLAFYLLHVSSVAGPFDGKQQLGMIVFTSAAASLIASFCLISRAFGSPAGLVLGLAGLHVMIFFLITFYTTTGLFIAGVVGPAGVILLLISYMIDRLAPDEGNEGV